MTSITADQFTVDGVLQYLGDGGGVYRKTGRGTDFE